LPHFLDPYPIPAIAIPLCAPPITGDGFDPLFLILTVYNVQLRTIFFDGCAIIGFTFSMKELPKYDKNDNGCCGGPELK